MNIALERERFEAFWKAQDLNPMYLDRQTEDDPFPGEYCSVSTQRSWVAWQARAALDPSTESEQQKGTTP